MLLNYDNSLNVPHDSGKDFRGCVIQPPHFFRQENLLRANKLMTEGYTKRLLKPLWTTMYWLSREHSELASGRSYGVGGGPCCRTSRGLGCAWLPRPTVPIWFQGTGLQTGDVLVPWPTGLLPSPVAEWGLNATFLSMGSIFLLKSKDVLPSFFFLNYSIFQKIFYC